MTGWVPWFRYQVQASADGLSGHFLKSPPHFVRVRHLIPNTSEPGPQCATYGMLRNTRDAW
jgi:hypothetical protein